MYVRHANFWILLKQNQFLIVITLSRLIWQQTEVNLVSKQSEKCNYNQNFVRFNMIQKRIPPCATVIHFITQRKFVKSNQNWIVFTMHSWILYQTDVRLLFQINRKIVYLIWFRFDLIRFRNDFSVRTWNLSQLNTGKSLAQWKGLPEQKVYITFAQQISFIKPLSKALSSQKC